MSEIAMPSSGNGRRMLLLIVGLLAMPFAIGAALYFGGWRPAQGVEHGRLFNPPPALPDELLRSTADSRGKWLLLVQLRGPCDAPCASRLDELRRVHVALYKNMGRLRRVVLSDRPDDPQLAAVRAAQPDLVVLAAPPGGLPATGEPLLVADPEGRLILGYGADAAAQGIRADLERLLKFSWNG